VSDDRLWPDAQPGLSVCRDWKPDAEAGALTWTAAFGVDRPPVELHEMSHDCEAETQAAPRGPGWRRHRLPEGFEDVRQKVGANTLPGVGNPYYRVGHCSINPQRDASLLWRELYSVRQEVVDDLLQPCAVTVNRGGPIECEVDRNSFCLRRRSGDVDGSARDIAKIDGASLKYELARDDAGHVEKIVNEPNLQAALRSMTSVACAKSPRVDRPSRNARNRWFITRTA